MGGMFNVAVEQFRIAWLQVVTSVSLYWQTSVSQLSLVTLVDLGLVALLLWWIYRRLRRSELIRVLPRLIALMAVVLVARLLGLWALYYFGGSLLVISILALAALYAPDFKMLIEGPKGIGRTTPIRLNDNATPAEVQTMIKHLVSALSVLSRNRTPAIFVVRRDKPVGRLIETGTKMEAPIEPGLLIDLFTPGGTFAKGAAILDGAKLVGAGSSLLRMGARIPFDPDFHMIRRVASDFGAVVVVIGKSGEEITLLHRDQIYRRLEPQDLQGVLQRIFTFRTGA
jgi:diadenylate cyclase